MDDFDKTLLDALRSGVPGGERYQRVMVLFDEFLSRNRKRLTTLIIARARAARLDDPDEVLQDTICSACTRLENQAKGKPTSLEFTGDPKFEGWLMLNAGDHRNPRNGGVIPTLLTARRRRSKREQPVADYYEVPDESNDETKAQLRSIDLEKLFVGVDPIDRCLFELYKGALSDQPTAENIVAQASGPE